MIALLLLNHRAVVQAEGTLLDLVFLLSQRAENDLSLLWAKVLSEHWLCDEMRGIRYHILNLLIVFAWRQKSALGAPALHQ